MSTDPLSELVHEARNLAFELEFARREHPSEALRLLAQELQRAIARAAPGLAGSEIDPSCLEGLQHAAGEARRQLDRIIAERKRRGGLAESS